MMYKPIFIYVLLISTVIFTACQKDEDALPEETQQGANTFGCKINGQVWTPKGDRNLQPYLEPDGGIFSINTFRRGESSCVISIKELTGVGIYPVFLESGKHNPDLSELDDALISFINWSSNCRYSRSEKESNIEGFIEITRYDMTNYIVSGRFEAVMASPDCDTLRITEGRFDVKFQ